jgi:hypothetical protein
MGFLRFRRRFKILPGLRLNVGKRGVSASIGRRGAWLTFRSGHKTRATVGLPGTGLSYTEGGQAQRHAASPASEAPTSPGSAARGWPWIALLIAIVAALLLIALASCSERPSPVAGDRNDLYGRQAQCGRDAREWFRLSADKDSEGGLNEFASHYNQKSQRCLAIYTRRSLGRPGGFLTTQLIDVNQNNWIAIYLKRLDAEQPDRCEVEGKRCATDAEWAALIGPYLHE